ncbi:MAG: hypothetical protein LBK40_09360, partial [Spirochaetaceae bacterium]|nr:hypothetical protein [Spirochaetaceae bacterium]
MNRKNLFILIGAGAAAAVLVVVCMVFFFRGGSAENNGGRANTLALAAEYIAQGEYQRALNLLDGLLIADANDTEARELRDRAIAAGRDAAATAAGAERGSDASLAAAAEAFKDAVSRLPSGTGGQGAAEAGRGASSEAE